MSQKLSTNISRRGSTLIEVLVAILIMAIVLTGLSAALTYSLKNSAQADYRQIATRQAQDVIEILRKERSEMGWTDFEAAFVDATSYCVGTNQISFNDPTTAREFTTGTCPGNVVIAQSPVALTRSFTRIGNTADTTLVRVQVNVTWNDGSSPRDVILIQEFRDIK